MIRVHIIAQWCLNNGMDPDHRFPAPYVHLFSDTLNKWNAIKEF